MSRTNLNFVSLKKKKKKASHDHYHSIAGDGHWNDPKDLVFPEQESSTATFIIPKHAIKTKH